MSEIKKEVVIDIKTMGVEDIKALKKEYEQLGNELRKVQAELRSNRKEELDAVKSGNDLTLIQEKLNANLEIETRLRTQRNQISQAFKENAKEESRIQNAIVSTKSAYEALIGSIQAYNNIQEKGVVDQINVINKIEQYKKALRGIATITSDTQLSNQRLNILIAELGSTMTNAGSQIQGFVAQVDKATDSELELAQTTDLTKMQFDEITKIFTQLSVAVKLLEADEKRLQSELSSGVLTSQQARTVTEALFETENKLLINRERLATVSEAYREKIGKVNDANGIASQRQRDLKNVTLQFGQVFREVPNFLIDARIGILSLSNNIPYLIEALNTAKDSAKKAGESFNIGSILKSLISPASLVTIGAVALTAAFTALSNPKVWKWVKELFTGTDYSTKAVPAFNGLIDRTKALEEAFKSGSNVYGTAVEQLLKVEAVLNSARKGFIGSKSAITFFNNELGDTVGKQTTVNGAIERLTKIKPQYLKSLEEMSKANALFAEAAKSAVEKVRLQYASNAELVGPNAENYIEDIEKAQAKLLKWEKTYGGKILAGPDKQRGAELRKNFDEAVKKYNDAANQVRIKEIALVDKQYTNFSKEAIKSIENSFKEIEGLGINILNQGSDASNKTLELVSGTYEKIREITQVNKELFKTSVKDFVPPTPLTSSYETAELNRQNELESQQKFFLQSYTQQNQNNLDLEKARQKDLENEKKVLEEKKIERLKYYDEQKVIINEAVIVQKTLYETLISELQGYEIQKIAIEKELNEQEEAYKKANEKGDNKEIARINERRKVLVGELQTVDDNIKKKEEAIKASEKASKTLEKEADDLTKVTDDINKTGEQIVDVENKIAESGFKIAKLTKETVRSFAEDMKDVADKLGSIFGDIAGLYEANMDRTNQYYDEKAAGIEEDIKNESQRNVALKKNEEERYKALEKDFENQKQWKKAQAWMDFASGTIGIWTAPGVTSLAPLGYILAAAQTAALLATTISNIQTIDKQKLKSPSAASSSSSGGGASAVAMLPQKAALTSNEENLNIIGRGMQDVKKGVSVVKVTDINNVQNDVKVRETNSSY